MPSETAKFWRMIIKVPQPGYNLAKDRRSYYADFWSREAAIAEKKRLSDAGIKRIFCVVKDADMAETAYLSQAKAEAVARYTLAVKQARNRREADNRKAELKRQEDKRKFAEASKAAAERAAKIIARVRSQCRNP